MKNKKSFLKMMVQFLFLTVIVIYVASGIMELTYSSVASDEPDVYVTIGQNGLKSQTGNLFDDELWYPGKEKSGVIRIRNEFKPIEVSNISLDVDLEKYNESYSKDIIYNSFNNKMKLTLRRGKFDVFTKNIIDNVSLSELIFSNDENQNGFNLETGNRFSIGMNDFVDLKYTLLMDQEAGNELQNITAVISMLLNVEEGVVEQPPILPPPPPGGENGNGELIEEPIFIVPDISAHWAKDCILWLMEKGIVVGYSDGSIKPDNKITRAETAVLVARALNLEKVDRFYSGYLDPIPKWAREYIIAVTEQGSFQGYPMLGGRIFKPRNYITREEMATVLMRGFDLELVNEVVLEFPDREDISDWAIMYVKTGFYNEIITGYPDNTYRPKGDITRAEAFSMICRLLKMNESVE